MGTVYKAEQRTPRRLVALKVVRPGVLSPSLRRRFELEAEVLGRLEHPGIARIYEAGTADIGFGTPQPFFAMELIDGQPLTEFSVTQSLDIPEKARLLAEVCDAVQHAHQKGIVHRDLKPSNILVTAEQQPKVLDFGIARSLDTDLQTTAHTESGQVVGTLQYMSPEQAGGDARNVDTRSDVYALGVIAYELMAKRVPYSVADKPLLEAVRIVREEEPSRLGTLSRNLRGDVETIVAKALSKEKDRRYASAAELAADLRRYLNAEPIAARPPSTWYQLSRFARRNRALVAGAASVLVVLVLGIVGTSWQALRATKALSQVRDQQHQAERRLKDQQSLLSKVMVDVNDKIEPLPGSMDARIILSKTAVDFMEKLDADASGDLSLRSDLALALIKLADVQTQIGEIEQALATNQRVLEIRQQLARAAGEDGSSLWGVMLAHHRVFQTLRGLDRPNEAAAAAKASCDVAGRVLLDRQFVSATVHTNITAIYVILGDCQVYLRRLDEALATREKALELAQQDLDKNPENSLLRLQRVGRQRELGESKELLGRTKEALAQYRSAIQEAEQLQTINPENVWFHGETNRINAAITALSVADSQPALAENRQSLRDLAARLGREANAALSGGRIAEARPLTLRYAETLAQLLEREPTDENRQVTMGAWLHAAMLDRNGGDAAAALAHSNNAMGICSTLMERHADDPQLWRTAGFARDGAAVDLAALGRPGEAVEACRDAIQYRTRLAGDASASSYDIRYMIDSYERLSGLLATSDHQDESKTWLHTGMRELQRYEQHAGNPAARREVSELYARIAADLEELGDTEGAALARQKRAAITGSASNTQPTTTPSTLSGNPDSLPSS